MAEVRFKEPTPYELFLLFKWKIDLETLNDIRQLSKKLRIPLTLDTAVSLWKQGKLVEMRARANEERKAIEAEAEKAQNVVLSRSDSDDDVSKMLRLYLEEGNMLGLHGLLIRSGCKESMTDRLIADWLENKFNLGIIRMRAGNMLRNALRRKIL